MEQGETFQTFADSVTKCRTDIMVVDCLANTTDEATIIRTRHGIKEAAPGFFLVQSNVDNLSLEKLNEKINAYDGETKFLRQ